MGGRIRYEVSTGQRKVENIDPLEPMIWTEVLVMESLISHPSFMKIFLMNTEHHFFDTILIMKSPLVDSYCYQGILPGIL